MWGIAVNDLPLVSATVLWLVFLEGLLSADNALVLAMMVRHLPKDEQKRALRYGIWGAFAFRIVAVLLANVLLKFWFLKVIGGVYLLYLAVSHFAFGAEGEGGRDDRRGGRGLWGTVLRVEVADIAFSIDSILAAVAMAESLPPRIGGDTKFAVVVIGGMLGIITMRFVAGYFIVLLDKFHGLEAGAYGLVAWIGLKLVVGGLHRPGFFPYEFPEWAFWIGMFVIVAFGLLYRPAPKPPTSPEDAAIVEQVARIAGGEDGGSITER